MGKENEVAFSTDIDTSRIRQLQKRITTNSDIIDGIVDRLVSTYCEQLDDYMIYAKKVVSDRNNPPTDLELDELTLNIPVLLYFTGEAQESLGIKEDVAKAIKQELYNEVYDKASGTIGDKTAAAELATQDEFITHAAYQRAYKKIRARMDSASEMLQSVKKVMSRRISEYEMSRVSPDRVGGR